MKKFRLTCVLILIVTWLVPVTAASSSQRYQRVAMEDTLNDVTLPGGASWWYSSTETGSELGASVASAGDINKDGFDDVIVGAPKYELEVYRGGAAMIFRGGPSGLGSAPAWQVGGLQQGALFGSSVGSAGDINGDTYPDVFVTAPHHYETEASEGAIFVYFGSEDGLQTTPGWTYYSGQKNAELGSSAACAGDINNDGYSDLIVGAQRYSGDEDAEGALLVFLGSEDGLNDIPDQIFYGGDSNSQFGRAVASAGNIDHDDYDDVIVGAPNFTSGGADVGAIFIYMGGEDGLVPASDNPLTGTQPDARFGAAVSAAGDVNSDEYADVIVGSPQYTGTEDREGAAYVYLGGITGLSSLPHWTMTGGQEYAFYGVAVSSGGFVNQDEYSEILVGANQYTNDQSNEGQVFLYEGGASGPGSLPTWTAEGNKSDTSFSSSVSTAGDIDGDGMADVVVGSPTYRTSRDITGRAFAYFSSGSILTEYFTLNLPVVIKNSDQTQH